MYLHFPLTCDINLPSFTDIVCNLLAVKIRFVADKLANQ